MLKYRTEGDYHGLYEIREVAREFIRGENQKAGNRKWLVSDPDIRVVVRRCAVPLVAGWLDPARAPRPYVEVTCRRTVKDSPEKTWSTRVPAMRSKA